eukprot:gene20895-27745_t
MLRVKQGCKDQAKRLPKLLLAVNRSAMFSMRSISTSSVHRNRTACASRLLPTQPALISLRSPTSSSSPSTRHICFAGSPETEEARSPLDAPQEWEAPLPSTRPDIFPEFEKMERVFLPKNLPGDPEMPDEELEERIKRTEPGDPDPEQKPGEPPEAPEMPEDPNQQEPERRTDIPSSPE